MKTQSSAMFSEDRFQARKLAEAAFSEGVALMTAGNNDLAEERFRAATQLSPDFAQAHANLGYLLEQRHELTAAELCYLQAAGLGAREPEVFLNLGALLCRGKRFAESLAAYEEGLRINPHHATLWSNLGALHACQRHPEQAEKCYRRALELHPGHRSASFNLGTLLLQRGDFAQGWAYLEARDWYEALASRLNFPRWRGQSLRNKRILITCEAGHGDMIQFCRYALDLKNQGAAWVAVLCHPALKRLFATLDGLDEVFALGDYIPAEGWDYWTPPLSLPFLCNTRLNTIPCRIPYVHVHPNEAAAWQARLPRKGLRVGLVWKGSTKFENDAARSMQHLKLLAPLWRVANVSFVSLQKGAGEAEVSELPKDHPILALGPQLQDFADTAALLCGLDLVISVDTAVAHLAGALGVPCWLMLPYYRQDWRWLNRRSDSPWYPRSMRVFRQRSADSWPALVNEIKAALGELTRHQIKS